MEQEEAKAIRREYRKAITPARVDAIASGGLMREFEFRRTELQRVKRQAAGKLEAYYDAFGAVDELIDAVAALVSHRVAAGCIRELRLLSADWGPAADLRPIRFKARDEAFPHIYEAVRVDSKVEALAGVVLLRGYTVTFNLEGIVLTGDGSLLTGSAAVPGDTRA